MRYTVVVVPDEEDGGYYAYIPDLQGCLGDGETPQDAVSDVISALHAWIEVQRERGAHIPQPGEESDRIDQQLQERADEIERLKARLQKIAVHTDATGIDGLRLPHAKRMLALAHNLAILGDKGGD